MALNNVNTTSTLHGIQIEEYF